MPLFGAVGSFTQPGFAGNRSLIDAILKSLAAIPKGRALELFSGLGNFTLPLAAAGFDVSAFEVDAVSITSLDLTLES